MWRVNTALLRVEHVFVQRQQNNSVWRNGGPALYHLRARGPRRSINSNIPMISCSSQLSSRLISAATSEFGRKMQLPTFPRWWWPNRRVLFTALPEMMKFLIELSDLLCLLSEVHNLNNNINNNSDSKKKENSTGFSLDMLIIITSQWGMSLCARSAGCVNGDWHLQQFLAESANVCRL